MRLGITLCVLFACACSRPAHTGGCGCEERRARESEAVVGRTPRKIRRVKDGAIMVLVPGGEFLFGALDDDSQALKDERPRRRVRVASFYMDETEVTRAQFGIFVAETRHRTPCERDEPCSMFSPPPKHTWEGGEATWRRPRNRIPVVSTDDEGRDPVTFVSWTDAVAYSTWAGATLPTERQFEFVLRSGGGGRVYPWGDDGRPPAGHGNYFGEEFGAAYPDWKGEVLTGHRDRFVGVAPVGSFRPDVLGLYDVSGNVAEWCSNAFTTTLDRTEADELADGYTIHRVLRGGSWYSHPGRLRCSWRTQSSDHDARGWWGFRCVVPAPIPPDLEFEVVEP